MHIFTVFKSQQSVHCPLNAEMGAICAGTNGKLLHFPWVIHLCFKPFLVAVLAESHEATNLLVKEFIISPTKDAHFNN